MEAVKYTITLNRSKKTYTIRRFDNGKLQQSIGAILKEMNFQKIGLKMT